MSTKQKPVSKTGAPSAPASNPLPKLSLAGLGTLRVGSASEIFDMTDGEVFGGSADILKLDPGIAAGPLSYEGVDEKKLELDGDKVDVHVGRDGSGKRWRLPLSTSFRNQIGEAKLAKGDTFFLRRLDDAVKKKGKGKGNPMKIFQIKVTKRAEPSTV